MSAREIDVLNELGLRQKESQSKLLSIALSRPEEYYRLRDDVEKQILQKITQDVFYLFRDVLSKGQINTYAPDGRPTLVHQFELAGNAWSPNLPFSDIQAFALDVAELIESKCEEAIEVILPKDKNQLAVNKQRSILKARTGFD